MITDTYNSTGQSAPDPDITDADAATERDLTAETLMLGDMLGMLVNQRYPAIVNGRSAAVAGDPE
jgi:hypothetical protein